MPEAASLPADPYVRIVKNILMLYFNDIMNLSVKWNFSVN